MTISFGILFKGMKWSIKVKLSSRLKEIKAQFVSEADPTILETMQRATRELEASGCFEQALRVNARAPQFVLSDERGVSFALSDFLSRGPLILHFFRGFW